MTERGHRVPLGAARRSEHDSRAALELVDALARAHVAGLDLTRRLCAAQALADASEALSHALVDAAADTPWDEAAIRRAVAASSACESHAAREEAVTREWAAHKARVSEMLEQAATLLARSF